MTWTRLDDRWDDSEKLALAGEIVGDSAFSLWARAVTFCNRGLTDGRISGAKLRVLTLHKRPQAVVDALVKCGALVESGEDSYEVHDFLEWNETKDAVEARRQVKRQAASKGGSATAAARQTSSKRAARCYISGAPMEHQTSSTPECTPSPSPSPSASSKQSKPPYPPSGGGPLVLVPVGPAGGPVERVWAAYVDAFRAAGRKGALVLNDARRKLIKRRLEDHAESELVAAARGVFRDAWCVDRRKTEPEWVWQNAGNIEKFADLDDRPLPSSGDPYKAALVRLAQAKAARDAAEAEASNRPALPQNGPFTASMPSPTSREASGLSTAPSAGSQATLPMADGNAS